MKGAGIRVLDWTAVLGAVGGAAGAISAIYTGRLTWLTYRENKLRELVATADELLEIKTKVTNLSEAAIQKFTYERFYNQPAREIRTLVSKEAAKLRSSFTLRLRKANDSNCDGRTCDYREEFVPFSNSIVNSIADLRRNALQEAEDLDSRLNGEMQIQKRLYRGGAMAFKWPVEKLRRFGLWLVGQ